MTDAKITRLSSREFEIDISFEIKKIEKSATEKTGRSLPLHDLIEIGVYSNNDDKLPREVKRYRIIQAENHIKLHVDFEPGKIIIDPYFLLIERNRRDNSIEF